MLSERGKNHERGDKGSKMTLKPKCSLQILITTGPTQEPIDKVRFISNSSTGKMGYELALAALARGHHVVLISGPANIPLLKGAKFISVTTALQMRARVKQYFEHCDCLIMAAAVSDFRPKRVVEKKIKKLNFRQSFTLELVKNPDILLEAGRKKDRKILVGFALEADNLIKNARAKLREKNLDLIVANQLAPGNSPFGNRKVKAALITRDGITGTVACLTKKQIAGRVLKRIEKISEKQCGAMAE